MLWRGGSQWQAACLSSPTSDNAAHRALGVRLGVGKNLCFNGQDVGVDDVQDVPALRLTLGARIDLCGERRSITGRGSVSPRPWCTTSASATAGSRANKAARLCARCPAFYTAARAAGSALACFYTTAHQPTSAMMLSCCLMCSAPSSSTASWSPMLVTRAACAPRQDEQGATGCVLSGIPRQVKADGVCEVDGARRFFSAECLQ